MTWALWNDAKKVTQKTWHSTGQLSMVELLKPLKRICKYVPSRLAGQLKTHRGWETRHYATIEEPNNFLLINFPTSDLDAYKIGREFYGESKSESGGFRGRATPGERGITAVSQWPPSRYTAYSETGSRPQCRSFLPEMAQPAEDSGGDWWFIQ